jgi:steroid 5-alpha reductase family enzyme
MLHFLHRRIVGGGRTGKTEYVFVALFIIASAQLIGCIATRRSHASRFFEVASGVSVAAACLFTLLIRGTYFPRQVIATALVCMWGVRLSRFLFLRNRKIERINILARTLWSLLCALPVVIANTKQTEAKRGTAVEFFWIASALSCIALESAADNQKILWFARYSEDSKADPEIVRESANENDEEMPQRTKQPLRRPEKGDVEPPVCSTGLWAHSRHPNLFFECLFWWCIYFIVRPTTRGETFLIVCPVILTLGILLLPGGIITQEIERNNLYTYYASYQNYKKNTPIFFPLRGLYRFLLQTAPHFAKAVCLDLNVFNGDS